MMQILFDSLVRGAELTMLAVGVTMVYSVLRFPNFAHVEFAPIGAYLALLGTATLDLPLAVAAVAAVGLGGAIGVGTDRLVFRHLRDRPAVMLMIAAFALGIVIRSILRVIWGPQPYFYEVGRQASLSVGDGFITPVQIVIIAGAAVSMLAFHLLLNHTRLGMAMRAVADNGGLSQACGIDPERVIRATWFIGSAFAALGGIMLALDTQVQPLMGVGIIIPVFAAAILGGIGSPYGAMAGALILAFAENIGLAINWAPIGAALGLTDAAHVYIPSGFKPAVAFAILILVLLVRPRGLFAVGR